MSSLGLVNSENLWKAETFSWLCTHLSFLASLKIQRPSLSQHNLPMAEAAPSYKSALDSTRIQAVPTRYSSGALPGAGVSVYVEGQSDSGHSKG